jgi:hypothetical protein
MPSVKLVKVTGLSRGSLSSGCRTIRARNNLSQKKGLMKEETEDKEKRS